MSLDLEELLNNDLEFFKIYMTVDIDFAMYLNKLKLENVKIVTYSGNRIQSENREYTQYITELTETEIVKKLFWFIPWKKFKYMHYNILAEYVWTSKNERHLEFKAYGEHSYNILKNVIKKWAEDNEFFVTFNVLSATNKYYIQENFSKYSWQDDYTYIDEK